MVKIRNENLKEKVKSALTFEQQYCPYSIETTSKSNVIYVGCDGRSLWKQIPEHPEYYVSTTGYVCSEKETPWAHNNFKKYLRQEKINRGHLRVKLDTQKILVHRLVAKAFIPNSFNKPIVHHIDGNPSNNNVSNLIWVTEYEHRLFHRKKRTLEQQAIIDKLLEERRALPI